MALVCPLCPPERSCTLQFNTTDYLKHIQLFHAHQPNFHITCGRSGCQRTFQKFHTFRKYVSDWHADEPNPTNQQVNVPELQETADSHDSGSVVHVRVHQVQEHAEVQATLQESSALFLMGLKEERKLTQVALQGVPCRVLSKE